MRARLRGMCAGSSSFTSVRDIAYPYDSRTAIASGLVGVIFSRAMDGEYVTLSRNTSLTSSYRVTTQ